MRKHLKINAYGCAMLLLATAGAKLYSWLAGTLTAFETVDPVIGLPVSWIVPTVSTLEIILAVCFLRWPLSYACHVFQVSLFAGFGWYRVLLSVLGVNFGCYCAGAIFYTNPTLDTLVHVLLDIVVWVLLVYSVILLIVRSFRGTIENRGGSGSTLYGGRGGRVSPCLFVSASTALFLFSSHVLEAGGIHGQKVGGVLYTTNYKLGTQPQITNAYLVSGVVSGSNLLVECKQLEFAESSGSVLRGKGSAREYICVGSEGGVLRTVRKEVFTEDGNLRTNIWLQVEPYLVPRVLNKPIKVAVLALTPNLSQRIKSTQYPIFMSALPRYPIFDVDVVAEEDRGILRVTGELRGKRKRPQLIWELRVSRESAERGTNLTISYRHFAHDISYITEVTGTLHVEETTLPENFVFRPPITPPARVVDYTLIDQSEILKKTDLSRGIWGGVSYIVTNALWEYDPSVVHQALMEIKPVVLSQASAAKIRSVRWAFALGMAVLLLLPLLLLKWERSRKPEDGKLDQDQCCVK